MPLLFVRDALPRVRQRLQGPLLSRPQPPQNADFYSFDDILAGEIDATATSLFGAQAPDELKAAVRRRLGK
jgi:hypothetical protein